MIHDNGLGGVSRVDRSYDFTGNVVKERESHGMADGRMDVLESSYSYDSRGRQTESLVSLNGGAASRVRSSYDELGRATIIRYGDYPVSRTYNIRSWQTGVSSGEFHELLSYESGAGGHPGRYNGSISGVEWRNGSKVASLYVPEYDSFDRLSGVEEYRQTASGWEKNPAGYEERGIVYDGNGNIKSLQRTAGGKVVDDLAYTYTGNQLTGLSGKVKYAQFLHERSELKFGKAPFSITYQEELKKEDLSLELPVIKPNVDIPVIELILNE